MSKYRCNEETLKFNLKVEGNFFESKSIRICTLEECGGKKNQRILYIKFRREEEFMGKLNSLIWLKRSSNTRQMRVRVQIRFSFDNLSFLAAKTNLRNVFDV